MAKHVLREDTEEAKPIRDWIGDGKTAVIFYLEGSGRGLGYVFIDNYCYSVDYNTNGNYWLVIRGEPSMSACYYDSPEVLQKTVVGCVA